MGTKLRGWGGDGDRNCGVGMEMTSVPVQLSSLAYVIKHFVNIILHRMRTC